MMLKCLKRSLKLGTLPVVLPWRAIRWPIAKLVGFVPCRTLEDEKLERCPRCRWYSPLGTTVCGHQEDQCYCTQGLNALRKGDPDSPVIKAGGWLVDLPYTCEDFELMECLTKAGKRRIKKERKQAAKLVRKQEKAARQDKKAEAKEQKKEAKSRRKEAKAEKKRQRKIRNKDGKIIKPECGHRIPDKRTTNCIMHDKSKGRTVKVDMSAVEARIAKECKEVRSIFDGTLGPTKCGECKHAHSMRIYDHPTDRSPAYKQVNCRGFSPNDDMDSPNAWARAVSAGQQCPRFASRLRGIGHCKTCTYHCPASNLRCPDWGYCYHVVSGLPHGSFQSDTHDCPNWKSQPDTPVKTSNDVRAERADNGRTARCKESRT